MPAPHETYKNQRAAGWARVDMLIALFDAGIQRLRRARDAFRENDTATAKREVLRVQRIVLELIAGLDLSYGDIPANLKDLYFFILNSLVDGGMKEVETAIQILSGLQEAFEQIRLEAISLENAGEIPPADDSQNMEAIA